MRVISVCQIDLTVQHQRSVLSAKGAWATPQQEGQDNRLSRTCEDVNWLAYKENEHFDLENNEIIRSGQGY